MTRRRVLVWREEVLAPSETFIANQAAALQRYEPVFAGLRAGAGSGLLPKQPDLLLGEPRPLGVVRSATFKRTGRSRRLHRLLGQVDLVHAHFGPDAVCIMDAARRAGKPLIVTFHGYDVTTQPDLRKSWPMTRRWRELVDDKAHGLVAVSEFIAKQLEALGAPEYNITQHHIGIPIPPDRGATPRRRTVLFVGRLVEKKGCDLVLRALARMPTSLRDVEVRILGDGPLRPTLEALARQLGVNATFLGGQPPSVVDREMWTASAFVGPSRVAANGDTEGLGMVFLEAAARRLPVITARAGGASEAVQDQVTGYVVDVDAPDAIAARLTRLFSDPELRARMGQAGRDRVVLRFDVCRQSPELEDHYDHWLTTWAARGSSLNDSARPFRRD